MALILSLEQQLAVNHESAVVIHDGDAVARIQLIRGINLSRSLDLQEIRNVDRVAAQRVHIVALVLRLGIVPRLEMIANL